MSQAAEWKLNEPRFLDLLGQMIELGPKLQNSPDAGLIPEEALVADLVEAALAPHIASGFLTFERLSGPGYERRPSVVISIQGSGPGSIGFVGAHFDVVPADWEAEQWERDPFKLWVGDDGTLYGRGVTDCLGHVALLTDFVAQLAERGARPSRSIKIVLISNEEEAPIAECGLDYVVSAGALADLKDGPIYWLDSADFGPTVGTGGTGMWELRVKGVAGHSGLMHNCVNALELGMHTALEMVRWFEGAYPTHADEARYGFLSSSTLKSTVVQVNNEKITKVPGDAIIRGDIRLVPFYDMRQALQGAIDFVAGLDKAIQADDPPAGFPRVKTVDGHRGSVKLVAKGRTIEGIACNLDSPGLQALVDAMRDARGPDGARPYAMTGSLPLVRDLQRSGFDVQITGFGRSTYYHAPNEQATLEHFRQGFAILGGICERLS